MTAKHIMPAAAALVLAATVTSLCVRADEFTKKDLARWQNEYMSVVKKGRDLWTSPTLGTKGVA
ncbi:MAG: hypothetical protein NTY01_24010, partial [Verrucomicrobia bacterium]|nr:hypothetical protein [Verrucomicrobiota bacterium]